MKVILDANIYISYLLARPPGRVITEVVEACLNDPDIELLFPRELRTELVEAIKRNEYLHTHIDLAEVESLLQTLASAATVPASLEDALALSRDPKDDYLLAYGLLEGVDYLITGYDDLLALEKIDALNIISAPAFWQVIRASGRTG